MAADIKNITEKFKKLSIDPVYDTNWCDMPVEIKLECIGKMEFAERNQSREDMRRIDKQRTSGPNDA
ncbi:hypothetical protein L3Y34_003392 [Caenorhabditis briggsae]|uniref:Uncharacterized protein n=1 Tax=Caenorhabditis briggsae TaxID=6238 RepID=A0AAE9D4Q3_CAEBR|nr:hypothetical protein L3Y34_003392 [Caenorhabditis briggsae]